MNYPHFQQTVSELKRRGVYSHMSYNIETPNLNFVYCNLFHMEPVLFKNHFVSSFKVIHKSNSDGVIIYSRFISHKISKYT
jgi:hypothetical protein